MHFAVTTACLALAVSCVVGQQTPAFAEMAFPGGVPGSINSLGKLVHVVDGGALHVWSAAMRDWRSTPVPAGATTFATNDCVLARAPGVWVAFGATRGRFASLPVSAAAQLVNPTAQNNDSALLVRDGGTLHAFSGFTGRWTSRAIAATASVSAQRHVALVVDGTLLSAFDAFSGHWTDCVADGPVIRISTDGVCGFVATATSAYGFSALHRAWNQSPANGGATFARNDDWAMLHDGAFALAYSGLTNTFASAPTGAPTATAGDDLLATLTTPGLVWAYSAMTGTFAAAPLAATGSLRITTAAALVVDGPQLLAFSAPTGAWAALALASGGESLAGSVLAAVDAASGRPSLFSALTGQWHLAPLDAAGGLPRMSTTGALLSRPNGAYAFSARTGAFVPLLRPGLTLECNDSSSPLFAWDATEAHFFDGRADRWVSVTRNGSGPLQPQIWRTCGFVVDGGEVLGFSAYAGTLQRWSWSQPVLSFRANSESSSLVGPTSLLAYSGLPEALPLAQFPDFRRVVGIGAPFTLHLSLPQGGAALLGFGAGLSSPTTLDGLGALLLDPNGAATLLLTPEPDADRAVFSAPLPADPALRGQSVWFQALVAPANAQPYLSDAGVLWIG